MILSILHKWKTRQVDFVLAYPQAKVEFDLYMQLPRGMTFPGASRKTHALKLMKNLYGQKQAGRVWNEHFKDGLTKLGFKQSKVDECVFYRGKLIFLCYVDDGIFASPDEAEIDLAIQQLSELKYDVEDKGRITDYLGINFEYLPDGKIKLSQPHLINQIIKDVKLSGASTEGKKTPSTQAILHPNPNGEPFDGRFHYRSVIGKLNYLEKGTSPDIAYAAHQCARFSKNPKKEHAAAVIHLCKYLKETRDKGIILDPKQGKSFEVFADADFCGNWRRETASQDVGTAKSRSGHVITYARCPILWSSKLQTQVALSTTKAEYIALSNALREVIPMMGLMSEIAKTGLIKKNKIPRVFCKAFDSGALELARMPKMRPRTKHINLVYHHFREFVRNGKIVIYPIRTEDQIADIFTKPQAVNTFLKQRKELMDW